MVSFHGTSDLLDLFWNCLFTLVQGAMNQGGVNQGGASPFFQPGVGRSAEDTSEGVWILQTQHSPPLKRRYSEHFGIIQYVLRLGGRKMADIKGLAMLTIHKNQGLLSTSTSAKVLPVQSN